MNPGPLDSPDVPSVSKVALAFLLPVFQPVLCAFYSIAGKVNVEEGRVTVRKFICCDSCSLFSIPAEEKDSKVLQLWH